MRQLNSEQPFRTTGLSQVQKCFVSGFPIESTMFEDYRRVQELRCEGYNATCPAPGADESWQGGGKGGKNEGTAILSIVSKRERERERERERTRAQQRARAKERERGKRKREREREREREPLICTG